MSVFSPEKIEQLAWRCLRTKPKGEHLAALHLRRNGFECFCPKIRHQKRTARGKVWFQEALFVGYVFARFAPVDVRHVKATAFVSGTLDFCDDLGKVPDHVVEALRMEYANANDETLVVQVRFAEGERVEIGEGPLAGSPATITKLLPAKDRARILLQFLGGEQEIEVPLPYLLGFRNPRSEAFVKSA